MQSRLSYHAHPSTWLFCIGQMKAGTTWFYDCTMRSEDIFTPPVKESRILATFDLYGALGLVQKLADARLAGIHSFTPQQTKTFLEYPQVFVRQFSALYEAIGSGPLTPASAGQLEWWLRYLGDPWTPEMFSALARLRRERYILDASPCSLLVAHRSLTLLQKEVPNPKVILLLRNPLRRLLSGLRMYPEWETALSTRSFRSLVEFSGGAKQYDVLSEQLRHSFVAECVSGWRHVYGDERIFVILIDEVARHREIIQQRLNDFLGIDSLHLLPERRNESNGPAWNQAGVDFLKPMLEGVVQRVAERLNIHLPSEVDDEEFWNDMHEVQSGVLAARAPPEVSVDSPTEAATASLERCSREFVAAFDEQERARLGAWMAAVYMARAKEAEST